MTKHISISSVSLLLSLIFLVLSLDEFVAKQETSTLSLGVTKLGQELLDLRNKAIVFSANSNTKVDSTSVELFEHLLANKTQLRVFVEEVNARDNDLFKLERSQIKPLIKSYALEYLKLYQSVEDLIRLVSARNEALNNLSAATPSPLEPKITSLLNEILLGNSAQFIAKTKNSLQEIERSKLYKAFIFSILALVNFMLFIGFLSWQRVRNLKGIKKIHEKNLAPANNIELNENIQGINTDKKAFIEKYEEISKSQILQKITDEKEQAFILNLMMEKFDKAAIALVKHMNKAELNTLFKALHTIKGVALQLELTELATLSRESEAKAKSGILPSHNTLQTIIDLMLANNQKAKEMIIKSQAKTKLIESV